MDAEEPACLLGGELLSHVSVRDVEGGAEGGPVVEAEKQQAGHGPEGVSSECANAAEQHVGAYDQADESGLILD